MATIKKYTHGNPDTDGELFATVGGMALNPKVHTELGSAVTSIEGDHWYLSLDKNGTLQGFCQTRKLKNGKLHIRFLYAEGLGMKTKNALVKKVLDDAKAEGVEDVYTNDCNLGFWALFGFMSKDDKKPGRFTRLEKKL